MYNKNIQDMDMIYRKIRSFIWILFLAGVCYFPNAGVAKATVMVGAIERYGKTYINYFMNHDYLERDKPYLYEYSVKALERIRKQLVREEKIEDKWVVWEIPSAVYELKSADTIIEKKEKCDLSYGETGVTYPAQNLNQCYSVYYVGDVSYQDLLATLLTLQQVNDQNPKVIVDNRDKMINDLKPQLQTYSGGKYYSKPVWSLDSRYVAFGIWNDGVFNYEVYDVEQEKYFQTDPLKYGIAVEPVWFPAGRYLAYASLSEVNIYDTVTGKTEKNDISHLTEKRNFEILLSYDVDENKILFAFDRNLLSNYDVYGIDLQNFEIRLRTEDIGYISWKNTINNNIKQVTSPDGRFEAKVEDKIEESAKSVTRLAEKTQKIEKTNTGYNIVWSVLGVAGLLTVFLLGWLLGLKRSPKPFVDNLKDQA